MIISSQISCVIWSSKGFDSVILYHQKSWVLKACNYPGIVSSPIPSNRAYDPQFLHVIFMNKSVQLVLESLYKGSIWVAF